MQKNIGQPKNKPFERRIFKRLVFGVSGDIANHGVNMNTPYILSISQNQRH